MKILFVKYFSVVHFKRICSKLTWSLQDRFLVFLRFLLPQSSEKLGPLQDLFAQSTRVYMSLDKVYHLPFTVFKSYNGGLTLSGCQVPTKVPLQASSIGLKIKNHMWVKIKEV